MVILKDVDFEDLETVVKFIYHGIVNVSSDKLPAVLNTADALQIKGLEKTNELMASVLSSSTHSSQVGSFFINHSLECPQKNLNYIRSRYQ